MMHNEIPKNIANVVVFKTKEVYFIIIYYWIKCPKLGLRWWDILRLIYFQNDNYILLWNYKKLYNVHDILQLMYLHLYILYTST